MQMILHFILFILWLSCTWLILFSETILLVRSYRWRKVVHINSVRAPDRAKLTRRRAYATAFHLISAAADKIRGRLSKIWIILILLLIFTSRCSVKVAGSGRQAEPSNWSDLRNRLQTVRSYQTGSG